MKILFAFENPLPSREADAEVFCTTARHLAARSRDCSFHVPVTDEANRVAVAKDLNMPVVPARAPLRPAALRHLLCGFSIVRCREFRDADLIYTRNLWIAWMALRHGQRVVYDHYRPWPEQIPPLQRWIHRLMSNPRFLLHICHSEYTLEVYRRIGVAPAKLHCVRNGFDPGRLSLRISRAEARRRLGCDPSATTVVYTGRINHKKGLGLVIEAAGRLPEVRFLLVGSRGSGPIEKLAENLPNVRIVAWQSPEHLAPYLLAADMLLIPPSSEPLTQFGSTVLPLKVYLYLAAGRPIIAGRTPDIGEVLTHERNAWLCRVDDADALTAGIRRLRDQPDEAERLAANALADSQGYTWAARAGRIADLVAERLAASPAPATDWDRARGRHWRRQSWRWLAHLLRRGSWVLPPGSEVVDARPR
jgi:Glycosyltransferase